MKIFTFTIIGICLVLHGLSQDPHKVDSLNNLLLVTNDDSVKASAIRSLVGELVYTKPDSCLYYTELGLELITNSSVKIRFERSEDPNLYGFESYMYSRRAIAFSEKRNDLLAIRMALKTRQVAANSKHTEVAQFIDGALAEVYQNIGEPRIARNYLFNMLSIAKDEISRQIWVANLGSCYYDLKAYDSALYYLNKVDPGLLLGDKIWPFPTLYLGHTYVKKGDYKKAIPYYRTSIAYAEQDHYGYDLCRAYMGIADAFKGLEMTDSAILYATRCSNIATELSLPAQSLDANTFLANLYESKAKIDSAFKYQKISNALRDTIFNTDKIKEVQNYTFSEKLREKEIIDDQVAYKNKIRFYSLAGGLVALAFLTVILIRNNRHKQKAYALLQKQKQETDIQKSKTEKTLEELRTTQAQLIQSEKMASLGELTAGIAHEIENPLNFVNNFSEVNKELVDELQQELKTGKIKEALAISNNIKDNEEKIIHHGKRADAIVKGMMQHARTSSGQKELTDINALADEYLRLAYHGLRAKDKSFNVKIETDFDTNLSADEAGIGKISIIPQDIGRVLVNLFNNAFYAASLPSPESIGTGVGGFTDSDRNKNPTVWLSTKKIDGKVLIYVRDNGPGIPQKILDKIFQPFFTTKPAGQGTGLGLSLAYDIVKAHGGEIKVETKEGEGSEFIIQLPVV
jgi:two-component system NtrC family sensor kinase